MFIGHTEGIYLVITKKIDVSLEHDMVVIAVGGTAMTLLGLNQLKMLIFVLRVNLLKSLGKKLHQICFKMDITLQLPGDYLEKANDYPHNFKH
jgi:hypothetical protein